MLPWAPRPQSPWPLLPTSSSEWYNYMSFFSSFFFASRLRNFHIILFNSSVSILTDGGSSTYQAISEWHDEIRASCCHDRGILYYCRYIPLCCIGGSPFFLRMIIPHVFFHKKKDEIKDESRTTYSYMVLEEYHIWIIDWHFFEMA